MAVRINVQSDIDKVVRRLADEARKQVPFATALAITRTAKAVEQDLRGELGSKFDRPTPYVAKGTFSTSAKKTDLTAWVGMRDQARRGASPAAYVREQFGGGVRGQKPFEKAMQAMGVLPTGWRAMPGDDMGLDRYGNPKRKDLAEVFGALRTRMSVNRGRGRRAYSVGYFVVMPNNTDPRTRHLRPGIWRRRETFASGGSNDRPPIAVFVFVRSAAYRQRIDLPKLTAITVKREFSAQFNRALSSAMSTAR